MSTSVWMKRSVFAGGVLLLAIAGITPAGAAAASAKSALSTRLDVERGSVGTHDDVVLRYTLRNDSTADMLVVYWQTPVRGVMNDLFDVRRDGQRVDYVGALYKFAAPTANDYIRLAAGSERSVRVDLSRIYDISRTGEYTVRYRVALQDAVRDACSSRSPGRARVASSAASRSIDSATVFERRFSARVAATAAALPSRMGSSFGRRR